jgi:hypothetical protein
MAMYAQIAGTQQRTARVGLNVAKIHRLFMLFAVAAAGTGAAGATDTAAVPDSLRACAAIRSDSDRHACYDREMARLLPESAAAAAAATATAAAAAPLTPEQRFGLSASQADAKVTQVTETKPLDVLEGKVTGIRSISNGRVLLDLDNGQVWRQVDTDVTVTAKPGDSVSIKKNKLGSYWLTCNGRAWRVKRIQ